MSDTDKTRPEWVQLFDPYNKGWLQEHHIHHSNPCDIADWSKSGRWYYSLRRCHYRPSEKAVSEGIYPRPSKAVKYYVYGRVRKERASWRELSSRIIKGDMDAVDASPLTYNHRHSALWDSF